MMNPNKLRIELEFPANLWVSDYNAEEFLAAIMPLYEKTLSHGNSCGTSLSKVQAGPSLTAIEFTISYPDALVPKKEQP